MAVVQNPVIGRASQSYANVTLTTWKGINVLKAKPLKVANPRSEGQTAQRTAFSSAVVFCKGALNLMRIGFKKLAIRKSEYNVGMTKNIKNFSDTVPNQMLISANAVISQGNNATLDSLTVTGGTTTELNWTSPANQPNANPGDKVHVLAVNVETGESQEFLNAGLRGTNSLFITLRFPYLIGVKFLVFTQGFATNEASNTQVL